MNPSLNQTLSTFAAAEGNLGKLERLWSEISNLMPKGFDFSDNPSYDEKCIAFEAILAALPSIGGWKPNIAFLESSAIAQMNLDCHELGEAEAYMHAARVLDEPIKLLREYRIKFDRRRAELLREALDAHLVLVDELLAQLQAESASEIPASEKVTGAEWDALKARVSEIEALLGSTTRPARWGDLRRHLSFGMVQDLRDIIRSDWPAIRPALSRALYGENDPLAVGISDLDELASPQPTSSIVTTLPWQSIDAATFERLVFRLISSEEGYENPAWLMATNAPDRGRDLSVDRISIDRLAGTTRLRVIIQCKHWLAKSISPADIATLREQIRLWEPPRVDVVVLATSGRFTADAVSAIDRQNVSDSALRIEMWPESHLEMLLAGRPALVAEFFRSAR